MLTKDQEEHLDSIIERMNELVRSKYEAGAIAHGGLLSDLSDEQLEQEELFEMLDLLVYRVTRIINKLKK
jgi:hypothetical protein